MAMDLSLCYCVSTLLRGHEVDAPVLLPAGFLLFGALRTFLAIADGLQPVGGNAESLEKVLGGAGPPTSLVTGAFR